MCCLIFPGRPTVIVSVAPYSTCTTSLLPRIPVGCCGCLLLRLRRRPGWQSRHGQSIRRPLPSVDAGRPPPAACVADLQRTGHRLLLLSMYLAIYDRRTSSDGLSSSTTSHVASLPTSGPPAAQPSAAQHPAAQDRPLKSDWTVQRPHQYSGVGTPGRMGGWTGGLEWPFSAARSNGQSTMDAK